MRRFVGSIIVLLFMITSPAAGQDAESSDHEADIRDAIAAAEHWLAIVDSAGWAKSHTEAAQYFKSVVAADVWVQQIRGVRMHVGQLVARTLADSQYATTLPGAPEGEYVVLTYSARFANEADAIETVTPMKDPDGEWRVSGYYVR